MRECWGVLCTPQAFATVSEIAQPNTSEFIVLTAALAVLTGIICVLAGLLKERLSAR